MRIQRAQREQRRTDVAQSRKDAVQLRLVGHRAGERARAVVARRDGKLLEPSRPAVVKVTDDAHLVGLPIVDGHGRTSTDAGCRAPRTDRLDGPEPR